MSAYARTTRLEYIPGEVPALLVMLFLGTSSVSSMFSLLVVEGALAFLLLFTAGFAINAVTDYEIDKTYGTFKSKLPEAVEIVGKRGMWALILLETAAAMVLSMHISIVMGSAIPFLLVAVGVFMGLGYSVGPFRFKERGLLHAISLASSAFYLPCLFLFYVISGSLPIPIIIFFLGFAFIHYGMEFGNQAIDYFEDRDNRVMTPPVRWGLRRSLWFGLYLMVIGFGIELATLHVLVAYKFAGTAAAEAFPMDIWMIVFSLLLLGGYLLPFVRTAQMIKASGETAGEATVARTMRRLCKYSRWQFSGIMGLTLVSAILFMAPMLFPMVQIPVQDDVPDGFTVAFTSQFLEAESRTVLRMEIISSADQFPGDLAVVGEALFAGRTLESRKISLNTMLPAGEKWVVEIALATTRANATRFNLQVLSLSDDGLIPVWEHSIQCQKTIYIADAEYDILQGYMVGRKANVSAVIYSDSEEAVGGSLEVVVTAYSSMGVFLDKEHIVIKDGLCSGSSFNASAVLDIFDSGSAFFVIELFSTDGVLKDSIMI